MFSFPLFFQLVKSYLFWWIFETMEGETLVEGLVRVRKFVVFVFKKT